MTDLVADTAGPAQTGLGSAEHLPTLTPQEAQAQAGAPGADSDAAIFNEAKDRFRRCQKWETTARNRWMDDLKFSEGDADNYYQWPNSIRRDREIDERPCLTVNKVRQHNLHIINDAKQNKPGIKVLPTGNGATVASAKVLNAIMRHIEYTSNAQVAYDTGVSFAVRAGKGWLRIVTDWEDPDSMQQVPYIRRVTDPLTIYLDPEAKEADKSDAMFGFVFEDMAKDEFNRLYPQFAGIAGVSTLDDGTGWIQNDEVRRAEYYRKVVVPDVLYELRTQSGTQTFRKSELQAANAEALLASIEANKAVRKRDTETVRVEWYLIIGGKIVQRNIWPGKYIPLIPVIGEETIIQGEYDCKGHTRALKDPQRMYNYMAPTSLDTPIPTPNGWTTMGEVRVGDWLFDENGKPVQVAGLSPIFINRECYAVEFDGGHQIVADADHKWTVEERGKRKSSTYDWTKKTITTKELVAGKHFIWAAKPLELESKNLPIDPYVLGAWLGDGSSYHASITSGLQDVRDMHQLLRESGHEVGEPQLDSSGSAYNITVHGIKGKLVDLGLIQNKHIPAEYLRASKKQRFELLRGLMDTDGHIAANNQCSFTTTSVRLRDNFAELLRSLGFKSSYVKQAARVKKFPSGEFYASQECYFFCFTPSTDEPVFKLMRKYSKQNISRKEHLRRTKRHKIKSVSKVASVPVRCVGIESESHLFLAGRGMVPTHNSVAVEYSAVQTKTPWIAPAEAIEGYEQDWAHANTVNKSVLAYNALSEDGQTEIPAPQRVQPPVSMPAAMEGMQEASLQMMFASGQYQSEMGQASNERSAKAINERQRQAENATYHFTDNLAIAVRCVGKQLMDLIPKLYTAETMLHIMAEDGTSMEVRIDPSLQQAMQIEQANDAQAIQQILFNPQVGKYDVQADVGPSWGTRREETFNALSLILTQAPQLTSLIGDLLLQSSSFDLAQEAAERMRRMVPPQALGSGPTMQEQQLQQQLQAVSALLQQTMQELANEKLKLRGKDALRDIDSYKARTDRLKSLVDAATKQGIPVDPAELRRIILETEADVATNNGLADVDAATAPALQAAAVTGQLALPLGDVPPMPGARKGPDGHWYVRNYAKSGQYALVQ